MEMQRRFEGKVAFITGAGGGLGRGVAIAFAKEGANVVVTDLSEKANLETAKMIEEMGSKALAVKVDVTKSEDIRNALDKTIETFGKLDIAFNNAGIEYKIQPLHEIEEEEFERLNSIDLLGVFKSMKYEIPLMLKMAEEPSSILRPHRAWLGSEAVQLMFRQNTGLSALPNQRLWTMLLRVSASMRSVRESLTRR